MNSLRILAIVLMVLGALALVYGGFSYTSETHEASIGVLRLSIDEKRNVNIPVWAGAPGTVVKAYMSSGT